MVSSKMKKLILKFIWNFNWPRRSAGTRRAEGRARPSAPARLVTAAPGSGALRDPRGPEGRSRGRARAGGQVRLLHMEPGPAGRRARGPGPLRSFLPAAAPRPAGEAGQTRRKSLATPLEAREEAKQERRGRRDLRYLSSSLLAARPPKAEPPSSGAGCRAATTHRPVMSGVARRCTSRRLAGVRATPPPAPSGTAAAALSAKASVSAHAQCMLHPRTRQPRPLAVLRSLVLAQAPALSKNTVRTHPRPLSFAHACRCQVSEGWEDWFPH